MNSICPFESADKVDPKVVKANVAFWRKKHGKPDKFVNSPRILKLTGKKITIDVNPNTGECEVGS